MKHLVVWHPEFLRALLGILGEPEQVSLQIFQAEVTTELEAKLTFYPQYSKLVHYKDNAKPIDFSGLVDIYASQISDEKPPKMIEKISWSNFYAGKPLVSAVFEPGLLTVEIQYVGSETRELLDRLHKAVEAWKPRPPSDVRVVFS
jgi:hypothetical protein